MPSLKRAVVSLAALPPFPSLLDRMLQRGPTVFALHRFENPDLGVSGHSPAVVRQCLGMVRRLGYRVLPIDDALRSWASGTLPYRSVVFTVDDGFRDFITHGAPVFREFDCPVTMFAATGFVDGKTWFWWDKLEYMLGRAARGALALEIGGETQRYSWTSAAERQTAYVSIVMYLKRHSPEVQQRALADAAVALEVDVSDRAPESHAPMSWEECNELASQGVTLGPHSVTHVNLARASDDDSRREIVDSWRRIRDVAKAPCGVFCYPFGVETSFGPREELFVKEAGLVGAVTLPLFGTLPPSGVKPFATSRHRLLHDPHIFSQQLLGIETLKLRARYATARALTGNPPPPPHDTGAL